jgi:polyhydroxyalkanoate synthesis repressor PhaR
MTAARGSETTSADGGDTLEAADAGTRIIKKYPNRRLYDTHDSRYVTLHDIARLVFEHQSFEVIDQKTGDPLTCGILLQIMAEQAHSGQSPLSRELLMQMIRVYNGPLPGALRAFLQNSLSMFLDQHQKIDVLLDGRIQNDPLKALTELAEENLQQWIELNKELLRAVAAGECQTAPTQQLERT